MRDIQYGLRGLARTPGFVAVVVLSLALGIGANSTIFSVLNAILYRPLPYDHPERLVVLWETAPGHPDWTIPPPIAELDDFKSQNTVFEDVALTSNTVASSISGTGQPEPIRMQYVTPTFFHVLQVQPILGRVFVQKDLHDFSQTIVISHAYWKRRFHSDSSVLGKTFTIQGITSTIVGVMPAGFSPFHGERIDLWWPVNPYENRYIRRDDHWLMPIARMKPGVSIEQAQKQMDVVAQRLEAAYPKTNKGVEEKLIPLQKELFGGMGQTLYPLFGAVTFVLLIACVNVANLFQSRTETRRKEYAVRAALGAGRSRLVRQMLTESALLALVGGILGVGLTIAGIALFRILAGDFPNAQSINVDSRVLLFTLAVSLSTAFLFGLMPAIRASRADLNLALQKGDRRTSTASRGYGRHALAVSEIALAMVLLVGAGLMIRSVVSLQQTDPGFDPKQVLTMQVQLAAGGKYVENIPGSEMGRLSPLVPAFYKQLMEQVNAIPGVQFAGFVSTLPTHGASDRSFTIEGRPTPSGDQRPWAGSCIISPGFFEALKIPLLRGRYLDEHDGQGQQWSVVVSQKFAQRYFPNENPIGRQITLRGAGNSETGQQPRQIVGIVGDIANYGVQEQAYPFMYLSYLQQPNLFFGGSIDEQLRQTLVLRTAPGFAGGNAQLVAAVKKAVASLDADQPVTDVMTMQDALADSISDSRFYMRIMGLFAAIAALLAAIGIYGVISYFVTQRTHEIGIRMALGAQPGSIIGMVSGLGLKLAAFGVVIGAGMAFGLTRLISRFLYGVKVTDPVTYGFVAICMVGIAWLACYLPARRAARVDPIVALREE
jgi:predicted permease